MLIHSRAREGGFTTLEIAASVLVLSVGCLAVAGVIVPMSRQREVVEAKVQVVERMERTYEQMRGTDPDLVCKNYGSKTQSLLGIVGSILGGLLSSGVDTKNPKLLDITLTADWDVGGNTETMSMAAKVYRP